MKLNKTILNFQGLYGDDHGKYSSEYIFLELIETRSKNFDWIIKPHIHLHLYQVFIVKKGRIIFQESTQKTDFQAPCIFLIPPTQLHGLIYSADVEGQILTISDTIIEDIFKTSKSIWKTFEHIQIFTEFEADNSLIKIQSFLENIEIELFNDNQDRSIMLRAYIAQFFICLNRISKHEVDKKGEMLMMAYFRKFKQNIKNSEHQKSVPEFASELNISPVHLNRICNTMVGKSAIEIIHQNLITEAQKYLLHTSYTISEIAYLLKFEYPNYFAKFFKKNVGMAPMEFRKLDRK